jgi:hypothetical protein
LHQLPRPLPPSQLVAKLFANFRLANLANSSPNSSPTSRLTAHCWTATCELPSSACTAGPQPASCPEDMSDRTPDSMSNRMPEDMPDKMSKNTQI